MPGSIERLVRYAVAAMAGMLVASASAEDFGELEGSEHSPTFTSAERKLFVDAVSRFRMHPIPIKYFNGSAYWLDDEHLVFSSREYPGWKAQADEPPRIVIYNLSSGEIRDSGYRGRLDCLNHLGDFMLRLPTKSEALSFKPENFRWFIGSWGQPAKEIEYDRWGRILGYLCRYAPKGQPIHRYPPEELPPDAAQIIPLLPGHGELRNTVVRQNGNLIDCLHLVKDDGTKIFIRNSRINPFSFVFNPWSNSYFDIGTTGNAPASLQISGAYKKYPIPRLLRFWYSRHVGRAGAYNSREGVLWVVHKSLGLWRKQGVYLDTGAQVIRVSEVHVSDGIITSPSGCKVLWDASTGDPFKLNSKWYPNVTDICEGMNK